MKQHPIPHNILDIEFKLFTKFTIREFAYMVIGVGGGGVFLYLYTIGMLPAIIAVPIFVVSSLIGLFLGLVPINDQKADVYLTNYIFAITRPTLRAWKNEQFDDKVQDIAESRGLTLTQGSMDRSQQKTDGTGQAQIIGGAAIPGTTETTTEDTNKLDALEMERIRKIEEAIAADPVLSQQLREFTTTLPDTSSQVSKSSMPNNNAQTVQSVNPNNASTGPLPTTSTTPIASPELQVAPESNSVAQTMPIAIPESNVQSSQVSIQSQSELLDQSNIAPQATPQISPQVPPQEVPVPAPAQTIAPPPGSAIAQMQATNSSDNPLNIKINLAIAQQQKSELKSLPDQPNSIMLQLVDSNNLPTAGSLVIVKDSSFRPVTARQTDQEGLFLPNKQLSPGLYKVEIIDQKNHFPTIDFLVENGSYPLVKVKALAE